MAKMNELTWAALVIAWYGLGVLALGTSYLVFSLVG
jgi:hypothetical protein